MARPHLPILAAALAFLAGPTPAQRAAEPPKHGAPPPFFNGVTPEQGAFYAAGGATVEHHRDAAQELAEARLLQAQLAALQPQRKGQVDAYVIAVALDSDGVFAREAREAGRVLAQRYGAQGRTITLAGPDGRGGATLPRGSPAHLDMALARVAELIDRQEDVLILYTTSHGAPFGLVYNYGDEGWGVVSPARLDALLDALRIKRRLLMVSACFSGIFVPALATGDTAILTASSGDRTSFGCQADSDWTFFGDALINQALRKPQSLDAAGKEAAALIGRWEAQGKLTPSLPQMLIGERAKAWLAVLDARAPKAASQPVGRPAVSLLEKN
ncbi:MAG: peptidase C13 [Proteobacteria bacterium SG_bin5]|nr:C13 family peptidase [Sphingomonas sp.]OQW42021.1 MAG: peptidase C13 [Proteobacteria bacterium SG_bin5]